MKIENMGVKISEVPYLGEIVIADGRARVDGLDDGSWYCGIEQLREMRDALDAAIREMEPAESKPVTLFAPGQVLDGNEDLPIAQSGVAHLLGRVRRGVAGGDAVRAAQWIFGIAALYWWVLYLIDPMVFSHLAVALGCTLAWFLITVRGVR